MTKKQKKMLARILVCAVMLIALQFLPITGIPRFALYLAAYLVIGFDILKKAAKGIGNGRVFDENFLMAVATIGAFALAIYEKSGDYNEAIAVMLFYQIGELFQSYAVGKSRKNISALMDIRPDYANIEVDGKLEKVDPDEVAVGSVIVVQPGEKVPLDGVIIDGASTLNTSALTGESLPRDAKTGDEIISGCINMTGVLKVRTTKEFGESTVSKILELVENSSSRKSRSEDFIAKFARIYTPAVCYSALALAVIPPVARLAMGSSAEWEQWMHALRSMTGSLFCIEIAFAGQIFAHLPQPMQPLFLTFGQGVSAWNMTLSTIFPMKPVPALWKKTLDWAGMVLKSGTMNAAGSPAMISSSAVCGIRPRMRAACSVGTSSAVSPMSFAASRSSFEADSAASTAPMARGEPCVGPFPSMPTTASQMQMRGLKYVERSISMLEKSEICGYL